MDTNAGRIPPTGSYKTAKELVVTHLLSGIVPEEVRGERSPERRFDALLANIRDGRQAGPLEFLKHVELIGKYATRLDASLLRYDEQQHHKAGETLRTFLQATSVAGDVSQVNSLHNWIELMSVLGILHGSTLSFTRLLVTDQLARKLAWTEYYTFFDFALISTAVGTIIGMMEDRHVLTSSLDPIYWLDRLSPFSEV